MTDEENILYRVLFHQDNKIFEVYSNYISEEALVGFLEVEDLVLTELHSTILIDPDNEDRMRQEFKEVKRCYIPIHLILRIDEIVKEGASLRNLGEKTSNVSQFPGKPFHRVPTED